MLHLVCSFLFRIHDLPAIVLLLLLLIIAILITTLFCGYIRVPDTKSPVRHLRISSRPQTELTLFGCLAGRPELGIYLRLGDPSDPEAHQAPEH